MSCRCCSLTLSVCDVTKRKKKDTYCHFTQSIILYQVVVLLLHVIHAMPGHQLRFTPALISILEQQQQQLTPTWYVSTTAVLAVFLLRADVGVKNILLKRQVSSFTACIINRI